MPMSEKIAKNVSDIIVRMTEREVAGKHLSKQNATEKKILSKLAHKLSLGTQLETADWSKLKAVKIAVNEQGCMDITTITQDQWTFDGSVPYATVSGTPSTDKG